MTAAILSPAPYSTVGRGERVQEEGRTICEHGLADLLLFAHADWGFPMRRSRRPRFVWPALLCLTLAVLAAVQLPVAALGRVAPDTADLIFVTGWLLLAVRCIARGVRRPAPVWWRTGFGLGIIAAGQFLAVLTASDPGRGTNETSRCFDGSAGGGTRGIGSRSL